MSNPLNFFLPALGGTALIIAGAYSLAQRDYAKDQVELLESRATSLEAQALSARAEAASQTQRANALSVQVEAAQAQAAQVPTQAMSAGGTVAEPAPVRADTYGLGRPALDVEIAAWDIDVLPDGRGLPEGKGDVSTGEEVFAEKCASCHGDFAEGSGNWPVLAGGFGTLADDDPVKTVGSYWPHLSTAWDYINRSMPFGEAGTLTPDETYAIVAYILYSNELVDDDFELNQTNFKDFEMHNMNGFVIDDRPDLEYAEWRTEPCMDNCKDKVDITMRTVFLVETPPEGGSNSVMNPARSEKLPSFTKDGPDFVPAAAPVAQDAPAADPAPQATAAPAGDADLIAQGENVFKKCKACHQVGPKAKNSSGPQLNAIVGRTMGGVEDFKYSKAFVAAMEEGRVWDETSLAEFLAAPKKYFKGTKMAFSGLKKEEDIAALVEYLRSFDE